MAENPYDKFVTTPLDVAKDTATGFAIGSNQLLKMTGDLWGLGTGDMDNAVSRQAKENIEWLQRRKTPELIAAEQARKQAVDAEDTTIGQALTYIRETFKDPRLALTATAEAAPSMVGAGGVGAGARVATGKLLARYGAEKAAETAAKVGVGSAIAAGAGMQGASVGADQYDEVVSILDKMPDEKVTQIPEIAYLIREKNATIPEAKAALAMDLARSTGFLASLVSAGSQMVPGGQTIERAIAGGLGKTAAKGILGTAAGAVKGAAGEALQEMVEEGGGAALKNVLARQVEPEREISKGVGESIGAAASAAGPMGGMTHLATPRAKTDADYSAESRQMISLPPEQATSRPVSEGETTAGMSEELTTPAATKTAIGEPAKVDLKRSEQMTPDQFWAAVNVRQAALTGTEPNPADVALVGQIPPSKSARSTEQVQPIIQQAQTLLDQWRDKNPNAPENITIVYDPEMLHNGYGIRGAFNPKDGSILINAAFATPETIGQIAAHEWAHATLATEAGQKAFADFISREIPQADLDELSKRYGTNDRATLLEEWIAENQEQAPNVISRIVARVREWLSQFGITNLTDQEVANIMLRQLRESVENATEPQTENSPLSVPASTDEMPLTTPAENLNKISNEPEESARKGRFNISPAERGRDFADAIARTAQDHPRGAAVEVKPEEFYTDPANTLFLSEDGLAGAAVKPDGDLVSVFKHPTSKARMKDLLAEATKPAIKLDAFDIDSFLPQLYANFGFRPVARVAFNDEYAPPRWNFEDMGRPDVVLMVKDEANKLGLPDAKLYTDEVRDQVPLVSYDEAVKLQQEAVDRLKDDRKFSLTEERAPERFYSQLERTLEAIPPKASRQQIEAALRDGVKERGQLVERPVKKEEMDDIRTPEGLSFTQWLKENPNATRDEMLKVARENRITTGEDSPYRPIYGEHTLSGGSDYREKILTSPSSYRSSHFESKPDYMAHVRTKDRMTPDGKKVFFAEEIQSDLHQAGREKGYQVPEGRNSIEERNELLRRTAAALDGNEARSNALLWEIDQARNDGSLASHVLTQSLIYELKYNGDSEGLPKPVSEKEAEYRRELQDLRTQRQTLLQRRRRIYNSNPNAENRHLVPDVPYKKSWHELAFRDLLADAVERGSDYLAWTTGEQQTDRYNLSKQISEIEAFKNNDGTYQVSAKPAERDSFAETSYYNGSATPAELESVFGKEIAQRIVEKADAEKGRRHATLSDLDLKVGGEGMKGFYDRILPQYADKYLKKYGVETEMIPVVTDKGGLVESPISGDESMVDMPELTAMVHAVRITPEMRADIQSKGQPRYSLTGKPVGETALQDSETTKFKNQKETAKYLGDLLKKEFPDGLDRMDSETADKLANLLDRELSLALTMPENADAIGWYGREMEKVVEILRSPELNYQLDDPVNRGLFNAILAITSNGQEVVDQFLKSAQLYEGWKKTGKIPSIGKWGGERNTAMKGQLKFLNQMMDLVGPEATVGFLTSENSLRDHLDNLYGMVAEAQGLPEKATVAEKNEAIGKYLNAGMPSGELKDYNTVGAIVFGPKLGGGFFANLYGKFDRLTMDRWFMRTFHRLTGRLGRVETAAIQSALDEARNDLGAAEYLSRAAAGVEQGGYEPVSKERLSDADLLDYIKTEGKKAFKDYKEIKAGLKENPEDASLLLRDTLRRTYNRITKAESGLFDAPDNGGHRVFIRDVIDRLQKMRAERGEDHIDTSDIQAILWYLEKDIWNRLKDQKAKVEEDADAQDDEDKDDSAGRVSYSNGALELYRRKTGKDYVFKNGDQRKLPLAKE